LPNNLGFFETPFKPIPDSRIGPRGPACIPLVIQKGETTVTDWHTVHEAMAGEQDLLRSIIDNIPDEVYVKDTASRFVAVNPVTARFLGASSPDEIIGKCDADFFPPGLAVPFLAEEQALLQREQPCVNREVAVQDPAGNTRWVLTTKVPLRDRNGTITGLLGVNRDITERKCSEQQLRQLNEQLEQRVSERTAELRQAMGRLEERDRARAEFVANVSHELKTPLASMKLAVENMLNGITGHLTVRSKSYLLMLREDCRRLIGTVDNILDMSRADAGTMRLRRVGIPFAWFVRRAVAALRIQAGESGLQLNVSADDGVGFVACDPGMMERVVMNVVGNAIKFTPKGGVVDITLRAAPASFGVVILEVADTGIGIDAEHLSRVTERYFRAGEHRSGTGLGLSIAKEILALHGGSIALASPRAGLGRGTVVSMRLPVAEPSTILLVGDDAVHQASLKAQLGRHGFRVVGGGNREEALAIAHERKPDAMIVDFSGPGLDGMHLIDSVNGDQHLGHMAIVAVTGGAADGAIGALLESFAIPALTRPGTDRELLDCLEESIIDKQLINR